MCAVALSTATRAHQGPLFGGCFPRWCCTGVVLKAPLPLFCVYAHTPPTPATGVSAFFPSPDDLGSMSLLWMSFVRDVRLLWEDGAVIPRMVSASDRPAASCPFGCWWCADDCWPNRTTSSSRRRLSPTTPTALSLVSTVRTLSSRDAFCRAGIRFQLGRFGRAALPRTPRHS